MQADDAFIYEPDQDRHYPYTSWELVVSYQPVRENGPGLNPDAVDDIRVDGIMGATAWCGKWGGSIVLDAEYRREVLAWVRAELNLSRGNDCGLWAEIGEHCLKDYRAQLSLAD